MKSSERAMKEQAIGHRKRTEEAGEMSKGKHFAGGAKNLGKNLMLEGKQGNPTLNILSD